MSEFNKLGFDPMVPLGSTPAPTIPSRNDYLLPPLPKPTTPVEPRMTPQSSASRVMDSVASTITEPDTEEASKPPLPGKMDWVPEALRKLVTPSKQKGIVVAGLASLAAGVYTANFMWPAKPIPAKDEVAKVEPSPLPTPTKPAVSASPVLVPMLDPPVKSATVDVPVLPPIVPVDPRTVKLDTPKTEVPKIDVSALPPLNLVKLDTQVKPAAGTELPPVAPVAPPMAPPLVAPSAPSTTPVILPVPNITAPTPPAAGSPLPPVIPSTEIPKPTAPSLPTVELPKTEPKIELPAPTVTLPTVTPPVTTPPAVVIPSSSEPTFRPVGTTPPPPTVTPTVTPTITPAEPRRLTPPTTPAVTPTAPTTPGSDYDVDVHYATSTDTFASISKQHLGDERYAEALRAYNGNKNVVNGQPVDVPPIHVLRKQFANMIGAPRTVTPASGESTLTPPVTRSNGLRSYDIPSGGMTLKEIAKKSLGDENLWGQIWELNPRLRADEAVPAGTRIKLPGDSKIGD
ncbi:hypothetical protein BH11PLA2_BH11PLA2_49030 [soil metagenome]